MATLKHWQDDEDELRAQGVKLPEFDVEAVRKAGVEQPRWIHFGAGNLFRAFHAAIAQDMADAGKLDRGVVAVETFSSFTVDNLYKPYDNNILQVVMNSDGTIDERVLAITADACFANPQCPEDYERVKHYFESADLQFTTFSITEKGYGLTNTEGELLPYVKQEIADGPEKPASTMGIVAALLLARYQAGAAPIAMVSTDNFSRNGERFRSAVLTIVEGWRAAGHVDQGFVDYVSDESRVSFPWSMIDRITPNPSPETAATLKEQGWEDLALIEARGGSHFAGFANTEAAHYLVIEDSFPNGRPDLTAGGVILTDRETAERADTMKVTACLNPLHTALAVYGCLMGYTRIWQEMDDKTLVKLILRLGLNEDLPVVVDPGVINPKDFITELLEKRLPNKSLPDTPQRIATDTSQKMPIRYGHTINAYQATGRDTSGLTCIPLVIAGWLRYLIGVDDKGEAFTPSPDPLLEELQGQLSGIKLGCNDAAVLHEAVEPILSNREIFDCDLYEVGLGNKVELFFLEELAGPGAVRQTLERHLV